MPRDDQGRGRRGREPVVLDQPGHRPQGHPAGGVQQRVRRRRPRARRRSPSSTSRSSTSPRSAPTSARSRKRSCRSRSQNQLARTRSSRATSTRSTSAAAPTASRPRRRRTSKVDAKDLNLRQSAVLAAVLNNPNDLDPANGKAAEAGAQGPLPVRRRRDGRRWARSTAEERDQRLPPAARTSRRSRPRTRTAARTATCCQMVRNELLRLGFSEQEINGGGLEVTTTFTKKAMDAAEDGVKAAAPRGLRLQGPARRRRHRRARHRCGARASTPARTTSSPRSTGRSRAARPARRSSRSRWRPGIKDGFSLKDTFDGNSPYVLARRHRRSRTRATHELRRRVNLITATEDSINTAYIDLTESMDDGPEKIVDTAGDMGIPPAEPAEGPVGLPDHLARPRAQRRRRARLARR